MSLAEASCAFCAFWRRACLSDLAAKRHRSRKKRRDAVNEDIASAQRRRWIGGVCSVYGGEQLPRSACAHEVGGLQAGLGDVREGREIEQDNCQGIEALRLVNRSPCDGSG